MVMFENFIVFLNDILWGPPMIVLLTGTHLWITWKTGFMQKYTFNGIKLSVTKDPDAEGEISSFAALTTALASTIGTGNIIGVATAIVSGGPGAVFWTWIVGIFGIATKYAESLIAIKYRKKMDDGSYIGGAMTALEHLNLKPLGIAFAVLAGLCSFGIGCGVQSNAIADVLLTNYKVPVIVTGVLTSALTALVVLGGVKSISKVCEKLVPLMSFLYIVGCGYILFYNRAVLGQAIMLIVTSAFTPRAAFGGFVGSTIMVAARYGIARGLFSNESGLGSAPIVAAASQSRNSVRTALISATGVFWDTVVVCLMTGLVLVSSIIANEAISSVGLEGGQLASLAFAQIPYIGTPLLVFGVMTFAFSTILGWNYYGERCLVYLFGNKAKIPYRVLWIVVAFLGTVLNLSLVWKIADAMNALMAIPNLIAILLLSKLIVKETRYYLDGNRLDERDPELK
ncbi:MAG: sodium:alanine symporter family protein [Erysipelotrichaceae bacterium]|nr:sodium:alanine symporter family protein [Erysipelotrichaceae bacterium]